MAVDFHKKQILVIDVGGSNIKLIATGVEKRIKIPSDPELTAKQLVKQVKEATQHWEYEMISLGVPCICKDNTPTKDPHNLGSGWNGFNFEEAFKMPTKVINDAAMQAIGAYQGGTMLFLGLGTGLGTALIKDNVAIPMEGGHLPYRKGQSFEDYVGKLGQKRLGDIKWVKHVLRVIKIFRHIFNADDIVLGGGNAKLIENLPENTRRVTNNAAFDGGFRMWNEGWQ